MLFIRTPFDDVHAVNIPSQADVGNLRGLVSQIPSIENGTVFYLEFAGKRLSDDAALIADIGTCSEAVIDLIRPQNELELFDAFIEKTHSRQQVWLLITDNDFASYHDFAEYHDFNYSLMVEDLSGEEYGDQEIIQWTNEGNIKCIEFSFAAIEFQEGDLYYDFDGNLDLNGINLAALTEMKSLKELALRGVFLVAVDLSALPRLTSLTKLDMGMNPQLTSLTFPSGMDGCSQLELLMLDGCIQSLDCTHLNCLDQQLEISIHPKAKLINASTALKVEGFESIVDGFCCSYIK